MIKIFSITRIRLAVCICLLYISAAKANIREFSTKAEVIPASSVPKQIMSNFEIYYPVAKVIKWEREKTAYKVYVINEKVKEIASFEYDGEWIQTEQIISQEEIPLKAYNFIKEKFPLYYADECYYVSYANGSPSYLVYIHLKSNKDYIRPLLFDITGTIKKIDGLEVRKTDDITADDYTNKETTDATPKQPEKPEQSEQQTPPSKTTNITAGEEVIRISDIILKQFKRRFPRAEKVLWTKQGTEFVAKLTNYNQRVEAVFLESGMQVYTSYPFSKNNIPHPIEQYFKNESIKYKFISGKRVVYESKYRRFAAEVMKAEKPQNFYEVLMSYRVPKSKQIEYYRFRFNQTGQLEFKMPYKTHEDRE
ncbi:MAG: hypothetical protein LBF01_00760 [Bacteroidales bacterium]|jgi:hypothetical protein|nr:hypothetical protein [Bacteroidales bacterium]